MYATLNCLLIPSYFQNLSNSLSIYFPSLHVLIHSFLFISSCFIHALNTLKYGNTYLLPFIGYTQHLWEKLSINHRKYNASIRTNIDNSQTSKWIKARMPLLLVVGLLNLNVYYLLMTQCSQKCKFIDLRLGSNSWLARIFNLCFDIWVNLRCNFMVNFSL